MEEWEGREEGEGRRGREGGGRECAGRERGGKGRRTRERGGRGRIYTHMCIHIYKYVDNVCIVIDMYSEMYIYDVYILIYICIGPCKKCLYIPKYIRCIHIGIGPTCSTAWLKSIFRLS